MIIMLHDHGDFTCHENLDQHDSKKFNQNIQVFYPVLHQFTTKLDFAKFINLGFCKFINLIFFEFNSCKVNKFQFFAGSLPTALP